jgi:deferrochelatase/peroxidase EfeB
VAAAAARATVRAATLTVGLGPRAFSPAERPVCLRELPAFAGDALEPRWCGGDVALLVAGSRRDAVDASLERLLGARPVRWIQRGFLRRRLGELTTRDLLGFKDGSHNLRIDPAFERHVWAGRGDRVWMRGGTYLVVRRIRLELEAWRQMPREGQERVIGRHKASGAPLGRRHEFDPIPYAALPADSHVRLAAEARMLRRSYSYDEGDGDAGLLFMAFMRDPARQYVPIQRRLSEHDALSPFARHVGSALFAIPPAQTPR